ncbi:hypothetical protein MAR_004335, partial [Mya arenaria]
MEVLKQHLLDQLPTSLVKDLLKHSDTRNAAAIPKFCKFYNRQATPGYPDKTDVRHDYTGQWSLANFQKTPFVSCTIRRSSIMGKTNANTAIGGKRKLGQSSQPLGKNSRLATLLAGSITKDKSVLAELGKLISTTKAD